MDWRNTGQGINMKQKVGPSDYVFHWEKNKREVWKDYGNIKYNIELLRILLYSIRSGFPVRYKIRNRIYLIRSGRINEKEK